MAPILRGDIVWADLDPTRGREQAGKRPVLVLTADRFNLKSETIIGLAVTSQKPSTGFPLHLQLSDSSLPKLSWVKIGQIRTLAVERIGKKLGRATLDELDQIVDGLNELIG
jgi:mRNA interferase MazF